MKFMTTNKELHPRNDVARFMFLLKMVEEDFLDVKTV